MTMQNGFTINCTPLEIVKLACSSPLRKQVEWLEEHGFELSQDEEIFACWNKELFDLTIRVGFDNKCWTAFFIFADKTYSNLRGISHDGPAEAVKDLIDKVRVAQDRIKIMQKSLDIVFTKENHHDDGEVNDD